MSTVTTAEFLNAFRMRAACFRALLDLSQQQAGLIAADDYAELLQTLRLKQQLLDHLNGLSVKESMVWEAWPRERDGLSAADRQACDAALADTESALALLVAAEQSSTQLLTCRRDATERNLQAVASGVRTESAYGLNHTLSRLNLKT